MPESIRVKTPSRLHLSLIDLNGSLRRVDGGLGVVLDRPNLVVEGHLRPGSTLTVAGDSPWVLVIHEVCQKIYAADPTLRRDVEIDLVRDIPAHVGLGSKTQLSMALAFILASLSDRADLLFPEKLARLVGRGGTSGIGYKAFFEGGFILDGGHAFGPGEEKSSFLPSSASRAGPAPTLLRVDLPEHWRFVCVVPSGLEGAHDAHERNIFQESCPIPLAEVQKVSHLLLMKALPAVVTRDVENFGASLFALQSMGFKNIEVNLQVPMIKRLIHFLRDNGAYGAGMSSFGPIVYGLVDSEREAQVLAGRVREFLGEVSHEIYVAAPNNHGAEITLPPARDVVLASEYAPTAS